MCLANKITNWLLFPFILLWDILVTALVIGAFIAWWSFLFGSVVAIVLLLIFAPELLFIPLGIGILYIPFFEYNADCGEQKENIGNIKLAEPLSDEEKEIQEGKEALKELRAFAKKYKKNKGAKKINEWRKYN